MIKKRPIVLSIVLIMLCILCGCIGSIHDRGKNNDYKVVTIEDFKLPNLKEKDFIIILSRDHLLTFLDEYNDNSDGYDKFKKTFTDTYSAIYFIEKALILIEFDYSSSESDIAFCKFTYEDNVNNITAVFDLNSPEICNDDLQKTVFIVDNIAKKQFHNLHNLQIKIHNLSKKAKGSYYYVAE